MDEIGVADYSTLVQAPEWTFPLSNEARNELERSGVKRLAVAAVAGFINGVKELLCWRPGWKSQSSMLLPAEFLQAYPCVYADWIDVPASGLFPSR